MNIILPMAGLGQRFKDVGYLEDKPFIEVEGYPMVVKVIKNLNPPLGSDVHLISRKLTTKQKDTLNVGLTDLHYNLVELDEKTEGAACTILKASVDMEESLLIANSDQLILQPEYLQQALKYWELHNCDAGLITYTSNKPHHSFAILDENSLVCKVVEKVVVSHVATVGIYYFKRAIDFWNSANAMIKENVRYNNEFYVAPVYNFLLRNRSMKVACYSVNDVYCIGTPDGLQQYLNRKEIAK